MTKADRINNARIAVIAAACALAADARQIVDCEVATTDLADLEDAIDRFEQKLDALNRVLTD